MLVQLVPAAAAFEAIVLTVKPLAVTLSIEIEGTSVIAPPNVIIKVC